MDDLTTMEQPGYMAGMMAGQRWATAAVKAALTGKPYDAEGAVPELLLVLEGLGLLGASVKEMMLGLGALGDALGLPSDRAWTEADLSRAAAQMRDFRTGAQK